MNLLFVKDEKQVAWIKSSGSFSDHQYNIFPIMPKAALALMDLGIPDVRLPVDFLKNEEHEAIYERAIELSRSWYRSLFQHLEYQGVDVLECCRLQMIGFFQDVLTAEKIYPRLIAKYEPRSALFLKYPSTPSYNNSMHNGTADVFEAVLQWRLQQAGVRVIAPCHGFFSQIKKNLRKNVPAFYGKIVAGIHQGKNRFFFKKTDRSLDSRRIGLSDLPKNKPILVGFGSGYDLLVIWPYLKALAREIGGFPLLINRGDRFDTVTLRSGLTLDDSFRFLSISDIPVIRPVSYHIRKARKICLKSLADGDHLPDSLRNPLLAFQFEFLWDGLVSEAIHSIQRARAFFQNYPPVLYLDDYCMGVANRAWTEVGNLGGVTTVNVPHGAVSLLEFFDFNARWAFAWGELGRENLAFACPEKRECVIVSGDPSMEALRDEFVPAAEPKPNAVLLLTGGFLHQVWTDMDLRGFISTWEEIARIAEARPSIEFIIKPHPSVRDLGDWYRDFVQKKSIKNMRVVDDRKLEDLLPTAFFAVLVGKPGTAGLVAALAGVPFVYLDTMLCRDVVGYRIWCDDNGVPKLQNPSQLREMIDQSYSSVEERKKILDHNRRFLGLYLQTFQPAFVVQQMELKKLRPTGF